MYSAIPTHVSSGSLTRPLSRGELNETSQGRHDGVITNIYICMIYYYKAYTGRMLRVLLSLQSKFSESTILLKGYEILK